MYLIQTGVQNTDVVSLFRQDQSVPLLQKSKDFARATKERGVLACLATLERQQAAVPDQNCWVDCMDENG